MPDGRIRCLAAGRKDLAHDSHQSGWALSGGPHGGVAMAASIATATAGMARTAYQCTNHHCCAGRFDDPGRSPAACFGNSFANAADCRYQPASRREVGLFLRVVWLSRSPFASRLCVCRRPVSPGATTWSGRLLLYNGVSTLQPRRFRAVARAAVRLRASAWIGSGQMGIGL